jgi:hypothetical protein
VIGASIWDSGNRWITIHGTNYLVVRDCVGYRSIGHGYFLEDGTEVDNILDHNLAVQACEGKPLPGQSLPFDHNEGAGFWWANSRNAFIGNVAVECDQYGFRYDAPATTGFDGIMPVRGVDGVVRSTDIRTLPFVCFVGNVAHSQRRYGVNLGGGPGLGAEGGVNGVGPDKQHPFEIRGLRVWESHWGVTLAAPGVLVDDLAINRCDFGMWRPRYDRHAYRKLTMYHTAWAFYAEKGKQPNPSVFPAPLEPLDDRPPVTVVTDTSRRGPGRLLVRGAAADNGAIRHVEVNGHKARPVAPGYARWEVEIDGVSAGLVSLVAAATDEAGNTERTPHRVSTTVP